jgi:hypothetical protein
MILQKKIMKSLGIIGIGCLLLRSFFISIKTYREYFKLKKTVEINKKMLVYFQAHENKIKESIMKKIIYLLATLGFPLNAISPAESWIDYYVRPNKICIEEVNKIPDINSYEWLVYIHKQCSDISTNNVVRTNSEFYQAIINKSTKITIKKLNQQVKQLLKLCTGFLLSGLGCTAIKNGLKKVAQAQLTKDEDAQAEAAGCIILGALLLPSFILSIKTIKEYFKLKKTLKINKKMLASLQAVESTKL